MTIYFTCKDRADGLGAQACGIISVMVLAKALGFTFVYTPMKFVAHYPFPNPSQSELRLWRIAWEQLLNFEDHHQHLIKTPGERLHLQKKEVDSHFKLNESNKLISDFKDGKVYSTREAHGVLTKFQQHPQIDRGWTEALESIRTAYARDRNDTPHFNSAIGVVNIAVHVRRGDSANSVRRFVGHHYFVNVLQSVVEYLESQKREYTIQLYSEGNNDDFPEFKEFKNLSYRLNDDHFDTLHHMVCADVFIMSKSTFSYLPALLNDGGCVVYNPFWLLPPKPLEKKWLVTDENGNLDVTLLHTLHTQTLINNP